MYKGIRERCRDVFRNFVATLVQSDDNYFIVDWRNKDGRGDMAIRYALDKKNGYLTITGDLGCCVSCWNNHIDPADLPHLVKDPYYWISKFRASSDYFTRHIADAIKDLEDIKEQYAGSEDFSQDEIDKDFAEMAEIIKEDGFEEVPDRIIHLFDKYDCEWYQNNFYRIGRRIHPRVFYWSAGLQMAIKQLGGGR